MNAVDNKVSVPGIGDIDLGLDWMLIESLDSQKAEIKRLAATAEASWYTKLYADESDKTSEFCVAFASRSDYKKPPVAAAKLLRKAIADEQNFICLIKIDEDKYWFIGFYDGLPLRGNPKISSDYVSDRNGVLSIAKDFIADRLARDLPVFTDCPEIFEGLPFDLDFRNFSLEVFFEYITKKDFKKAKFGTYTTVPWIPIVVFVLAAAGGAYWYLDSEANKTQDLAKIQRERQQQEFERKRQLASSISNAINSSPSASQYVPAYLRALHSVPRFVSGWELKKIQCSGASCNLTFDAGSFATWDGYLQSRPSHWSDPTLTTNIDIIEQSIDVELPEVEKRVTEDLVNNSELMMYLGNLSQVSRQIGVNFTISSMPVPVVSGASGSWIPSRGNYSASGNAEYLEGLSRRLPKDVGVNEIAFDFGDVIKFDMSGEFYGRP